MLRLANAGFKYLTNCQGKVEVTIGTPVSRWKKSPRRDFDLLVLDAFNSDAIPMHLLTQEAFTVYQRHLKPKGILAAHISNRSLNLEPVIINLARHFNYKAGPSLMMLESPMINGGFLPSLWMLLSHQRKIVNSPAIRLAARPLQTNLVSIPLWDG